MTNGIPLIALGLLIYVIGIQLRLRRHERRIDELYRRLCDLEDTRRTPRPLPTETIGKIGGNIFIHHHDRRVA